jgi:hypothetical protein
MRPLADRAAKPAQERDAALLDAVPKLGEHGRQQCEGAVIATATAIIVTIR